eukprot:5323954-Prymnesium_polylepis.1
MAAGTSKRNQSGASPHAATLDRSSSRWTAGRDSGVLSGSGSAAPAWASLAACSVTSAASAASISLDRLSWDTIMLPDG